MKSRPYSEGGRKARIGAECDLPTTLKAQFVRVRSLFSTASIICSVNDPAESSLFTSTRWRAARSRVRALLKFRLHHVSVRS